MPTIERMIPAMRTAFAVRSDLAVGPALLVSDPLLPRAGHCSAGVEVRSALQYGHWEALSATLLAHWGQSRDRVTIFATSDLPSFAQKLTLSSYSVEHSGHCFMVLILNGKRFSVKRNVAPVRKVSLQEKEGEAIERVGGQRKPWRSLSANRKRESSLACRKR